LGKVGKHGEKEKKSMRRKRTMDMKMERCKQ
jgi:hypothetical protein